LAAARAAAGAADNTDAQHEIWDEALAIMEGMLTICKQAEPVAPAIAYERMEKAKRAASISS
jgi:hypothetical protein